MPLDKVIHKFKQDEYGNFVIDKKKPYRMFAALGRPDVFLQAGEYYDAAGNVLSDATIKEYGLHKNFDPGDGQVIPDAAPKTMANPPEVMKIIEKHEAKSLEAQVEGILRASGTHKR